MSRGGSVGTTVTLEVRFYQDGSLYNPFVVGDVNIYDSFSGGSLVAGPITPANISTGVYQVDWDIPAGQTPGDYYDEWSWTPASGDPVESTRFTFSADPLTTAVTISVEDDEVPTPSPIEGVLVNIYDDSGAFVTSGNTDASGEFTTPLPGSPDPGTNYNVHLYKPEVSFDNPVQIIQVHDPVVPPNTNIFEFSGHVYELPEATDYRLCRLSGFLSDVSLAGVPKGVVRFKANHKCLTKSLNSLDVTGTPIPGRSVVIREVKKETLDNGYLEVDLVRGQEYLMHVYGYERPNFVTIPIKIPDAAAAKFEDIMFPYIIESTFTPDTLSMSVGDEEVVEVDATSSDLQEVESPLEFLEFASSDEDVAVTDIVSGELVVRAVSAGTATISVVRVDDSYAERFDGVASLTSEISVTVS